MVKSIGGKGAVRCIEVVRFSKGPLLEVLLCYKKTREEKKKQLSGYKQCYTCINQSLELS